MRCDPVEVQQLEQPNAQPCENGGLELGQGPTHQTRGHVVERQPALHRSVGNPSRQGTLAILEASCLGGERTIGVRMGTGGSTGASYLKLTLDKKFFPELWEARTLLTE